MKGKTSLTIILALTTVLLLSGSVAAHEYEGWDEIRPALIDGEGSEFVVDAEYNVENFDLLLFMPPPVTFNLFFQF